MTAEKRLIGLALAPAVLMALSFAAAAAEGPKYTFVEAGWLHTEIDDDGSIGDDPDGDGYGLGGSFAVTDMFHLFASYSDSDLDVDAFGFGVDVDYSSLAIGGGVNYAVSNTVDLVGQLAYVDVEVDVDFPGFGSASEDESGYGLSGGVRAMINEALELNGAISYVDLGDDSDDTTFGVGAVYNFTPMVAAHAGLEFGDDVTTYGIGVRLYVGDK
jgi:opacity protein-like surface antigen